MKYVILLTTNFNETRVVTSLNSDSFQRLDGRYNLKSRTIAARGFFDTMRHLKPRIVGYAIYSGRIGAATIEHSYTLPEYQHLEHDIQK